MLLGVNVAGGVYVGDDVFDIVAVGVGVRVGMGVFVCVFVREGDHVPVRVTVASAV